MSSTGEPQIDQTPRESPGEGRMRGPKEAIKGHKRTHHLDLLGPVHWPTRGADPVRSKACCTLVYTYSMTSPSAHHSPLVFAPLDGTTVRYAADSEVIRTRPGQGRYCDVIEKRLYDNCSWTLLPDEWRAPAGLGQATVLSAWPYHEEM